MNVKEFFKQHGRAGGNNFVKWCKDRDLDWSGVDINLLYDYVEYVDKYAQNTKRQYKNNVKKAIDRAVAQGFLDISNYSDILRDKPGTTSNIYLSKSEIDRVARVELDDDCLSLARDLFILGCYTGARFSDYTMLSSSNVKELEIESLDGSKIKETFIEYVSKKTKVITQVPLKKGVLELIDKINGRTMTTDKLNRHLPEICKIAGIDEMVTVYQSDEVQKGPKYQFVRSHTARRSFATNVYISGQYSLRDIAKFVGHSNSSTTEDSYILCPPINRINQKITSYFN